MWTLKIWSATWGWESQLRCESWLNTDSIKFNSRFHPRQQLTQLTVSHDCAVYLLKSNTETEELLASEQVCEHFDKVFWLDKLETHNVRGVQCWLNCGCVDKSSSCSTSLQFCKVYRFSFFFFNKLGLPCHCEMQFPVLSPVEETDTATELLTCIAWCIVCVFGTLRLDANTLY